MRNIEERKPPRRQSKVDLKNALLTRLQVWQDQGDTAEEAVEKLSQKQYDFLVDQNVNLDDLLLTTKQQEAIKAITRGTRTCKASGYDKKYPPKKIELYHSLEDFVLSVGGAIQEQPKENFRNLDFALDGVNYAIVLSNPRTKK